LILNDGIWPQIRSNMEEGKDQQLPAQQAFRGWTPTVGTFG